MVEQRYPLLDSIDSPADLRQLAAHQLPQLAKELREFLIHTVAETGGHFAAGLGALELTVALHYVYQTPDDRLVWDVGHQSYPHKILTGRRDRLSTIRKLNGLAPFPRREESEYDTFGVGHSSTSISAALGMALAAERTGHPQRKAVAIIGDGGMTAGLAFEALNNAGDLDADILVILNDNEMSISPNVGALSTRLTRALSGPVLSGMRESGKRVLKFMPSPLELVARRAEEQIKGILAPGALFEQLGFQYFGPVDGHDLPQLVETLGNLRSLSGPRFLHVLTRKGKGYDLAEREPVKYHAVSVFDPNRGMESAPPRPGSNRQTYTQVFSDWLVAMAERDKRLVGITPAMREGSGLVEFSRRYPSRYFDVGIAEQHSVALAAGMACDGLKPVVAIYSTFLQRAYDQVVHDVAIQNLDVLLAIDRAGVVGPDGATHAGSFDFNMLRCLPNMLVMAPADENEARQMLCTGFLHEGPAAVRYPRGNGPGVAVDLELQALPIGKAQVRRESTNTSVALLAFGSMVEIAERVGETLDATVVNMRFVKPLDEALVLSLAESHERLVTLEDNAAAGGAGAAVAECLAAHGVVVPLQILGLPDRFLDHGSREALLAIAGLDEAGVLRSINDVDLRKKFTIVGDSASIVDSPSTRHWQGREK